MANNNVKLGEFLKKMREERGESLATVSEKIGISRSYINRLENSNRENPSLYSLSKITEYYGIPFSTIEQFCENRNNAEEAIQNLDYILLNERYLFANIELELSLKMILRDLLIEIQNYCIKDAVTREDEGRMMNIIVKLRENLLSE
ncbi:helix-turn-helix domain-containing protein [Clostridium beijerinckii]|uniref:helix-turn-helix domain-containing protein n=1 Tax=Clostridium beijerinckii TaxID=1520 RepID=UPI0022E239F8|nr:helix-turn-helix transcriptional regulator [Clostridium beijerinckii]